MGSLGNDMGSDLCKHRSIEFWQSQGRSRGQGRTETENRPQGIDKADAKGINVPGLRRLQDHTSHDVQGRKRAISSLRIPTAVWLRSTSGGQIDLHFPQRGFDAP